MLVLIIYFSVEPAPELIPTQIAGQPCSAGIFSCVNPAICDSTGTCRFPDNAECVTDNQCMSGVCAGGKICLTKPNSGSQIYSAPGPNGCEFPLVLDQTGTSCLSSVNQPCILSEECASNICDTSDLSPSNPTGICKSYASLGKQCSVICDFGLHCSSGFCQSVGYETGDPGSDCTFSTCKQTNCNNGICSFTVPSQKLLSPCGTNDDCLLGQCLQNNTYYCQGDENYKIKSGDPCVGSGCLSSPTIFSFDLYNYSKVMPGISNAIFFETQGSNFNSSINPSISQGVVPNPPSFFMFNNTITSLLTTYNNSSYNFLDVKLGPNGLVYFYQYLDTISNQKYLIYTKDNKTFYPVSIDTISNNSVNTFNNDPISICVGNNIIIFQSQNIYINDNDIFRVFKLNSYFQNSTPIKMFQLFPDTLSILHYTNSSLNFTNITGVFENQLAVYETVFSISNFIDEQGKAFNITSAGYSVFNGVQRLIIAYQREAFGLVNYIKYFENDSVNNKLTDIPGNFNNPNVSLYQDKIYILVDSITP